MAYPEFPQYACDYVDIMYSWGKYKEGDTFNLRGKPYEIVFVMAHHESGCAWLVLRNSFDQRMYEYDIDYEQGLPERRGTHPNNRKGQHTWQ